MRIIDMEAEDLLQEIEHRVDKRLDAERKRIENIEEALALQAPSFDVTHAAMYCGRSTHWINNAVTKHNLPRIKLVNNSPRYLRKHLDHFLKGGAFTDDGKMVPLENETVIKRVG